MIGNDSWGADGRGARTGLPARAGQVEIVLVLPERMAEGLRRMAIEARQKPGIFNANLLAAAYSARIVDVGDPALERAVRGDLPKSDHVAPDQVQEELRYLRLSLKTAEARAKKAETDLADERTATTKLRDKIAEIGRKVAQSENPLEISALTEKLREAERARDRASSDASLYLGQRDSARRESEADKRADEQSRAALKALKDAAEQDAAKARGELRDAEGKIATLRAKLAEAIARAEPPPPPKPEAPAPDSPQRQADALSKTDIKTIKGYASIGMGVPEVAQVSGHPIEVVEIVLGVTPSRHKRARA